jgi:archaemetzincin
LAIELLLVPVGATSPELLLEVSEEAARRFPIKVTIRVLPWKEYLPLSLYNPGRMQFNAEQVNRELWSRFRPFISPPNRLLLGVRSADGYVEGLNFVFGLASPRLGVASVYTARLQGPRLRERMLKLILHETGHLLGLGHCSDPHCVMRFSNSIIELDEKGDRFCPRCSARLREAYGEDP